jgi:hypothetical protein
MAERTDFDGPESGYIVVTWNASSNRWQYRPVIAGVLLSDGDIAALGLDAPLASSVLPTPQLFAQRDPHWSTVRLGASSYTMGSAGCAVTACTMVASVVKPDITPLDLVNYLNGAGGFTSAGELYWHKVAQFVDGLRFVNYHLWRNTAADLVLLKRALAKNPQVVQVDFRPATSALNSHFVTVISLTEDEKDLNILDPWTAQVGTLLKMYSKTGWTLGRAVYALAEFEVRP